MQIHVEVVTRGKRGRERIATIERDANVAGTDGIGLTLGEVKSLAERLQSIVAAEQVQETVSANSACAACGRELPRKGSASIVYRTAFGKLRFASPRLYSQCRCGARAHTSDSFNPLGTLLEERTHPELLLCSANIRSGQCWRERIFMMQAAQHRAGAHRRSCAQTMPGFLISVQHTSRRRIGNTRTQRHVRAHHVVTRHPFFQHRSQVRLG